MIQNISTGIGGVLKRIKNMNTGEVVWTNKHNAIVNQGLKLMFCPSDSPLWSESNIVTNTTNTSSNSYTSNIFKAVYLPYTTNTYVAKDWSLCSHIGVCAMMACGKSDVATVNSMTELQDFTGTLGDAFSYGDISSVKLNFDSAYSYTAQYNFTYVAPEDFTCKEVGFYSLIPNANISILNDYLYFANYDKRLFSRVVLDEAIDMTSGTTYSFEYDLTVTHASNTLTEETEIFGLPAVKLLSWTTSAPTGSTTISKSNLPRFIDTDRTKLFEQLNGFQAGILSNTWVGNSGSALMSNIAPRVAGTSYYDYAASDHQGMLARPLIAFSTSSLVNKSPLDNMSIALDPYYYDSAYSSNLPYRATLPSTLKRYPDEVTENSSMTTYEMSVPYTDTANKYGLLIFGRDRWALNSTLDSYGNAVPAVLGIDKQHKFSVTFKQTVERI